MLPQRAHYDYLLSLEAALYKFKIFIDVFREGVAEAESGTHSSVMVLPGVEAGW